MAGAAPAAAREPVVTLHLRQQRGSPFTTAGFARMIERAADAAGLELRAHSHMLRHACGYALANKGHDTPCDPGMAGPSVDYQHRRLHGAGANRSKDFWRD
jgi:integrase